MPCSGRSAPSSGDWAGHSNAIDAWQDGAWQFSTPQIGWCAFVADEGTLIVWNGTAWGDFFSTVTSVQNLALLDACARRRRGAMGDDRAYGLFRRKEPGEGGEDYCEEMKAAGAWH